MSPIDKLKSVLCGPDGKCCIAGSDEDRAIIDRALQALEQPAVEPVYAFRRKGLDDFCTCSKERFDELSNKPHLFETTASYVAPQPQQPGASRDSVFRYLDEQVAKDMVGFYDAFGLQTPQTIKQKPVLLLDKVIDAITDTMWGKQKATVMYPTYRMYARMVETATLLNQTSNKQG